MRVNVGIGHYILRVRRKNQNDYNAQIFKFLQNWSMFVELITKEGREFHNLIDDGKKENLYESILVDNCLN